MRAGLITAALAVGALAVPYQKRELDIETAVDVVYVTSVVTVTATGEAPAAPTQQAKHFHGHGPGANQAPASTPTEAEPTSSIETRAASSAASTVSSGPGAAYSDIVIFHHNIHRQNHSASNIEWDDGLASSAAAIAATCIYAHNVNMDGGGYGQNIAAGVEPNNISAVITDLFYNGEVGWFSGLYGQANPSMTNFEDWGHFSQIVWKATSKVGCATQDCSAQGLANVGSDVSPYFSVCNYQSPGNYAGEYGDNVGEPLGHATANWNTGVY